MSTVTITARPAADRGPAEAPRTAFVLAGGAALGAMQAGMVQALYERGIVPDLLVGTSAGAPERRVPRLPAADGGHRRRTGGRSGAGCGAATSSRSTRAWPGSGDYAVED